MCVGWLNLGWTGMGCWVFLMPFGHDEPTGLGSSLDRPARAFAHRVANAFGGLADDSSSAMARATRVSLNSVTRPPAPQTRPHRFSLPCWIKSIDRGTILHILHDGPKGMVLGVILRERRLKQVCPREGSLGQRSGGWDVIASKIARRNVTWGRLKRGRSESLAKQRRL